MATEHRELGAHEHGKANIAIEGDKLLIEVEAPGDDSAGFECMAKFAADNAKVKSAQTTLAGSA